MFVVQVGFVAGIAAQSEVVEGSDARVVLQTGPVATGWAIVQRKLNIIDRPFHVRVDRVLAADLVKLNVVHGEINLHLVLLVKQISRVGTRPAAEGVRLSFEKLAVIFRGRFGSFATFDEVSQGHRGSLIAGEVGGVGVIHVDVNYQLVKLIIEIFIKTSETN